MCYIICSFLSPLYVFYIYRILVCSGNGALPGTIQTFLTSTFTCPAANLPTSTKSKYMLDMTFKSPTSPANFYVLCTVHYLQSINKEKQVRVLKILFSIRNTSNRYQLMGLSKSQNNRGGSFTLGFIDSRGTPTVKSQSFLESVIRSLVICWAEM